MATTSRKKPKSKSNLVKIKNDLVEAFVKSNNLIALKILFFLAYDCEKIPDGKIITIKFDTKQICDYCNVDIRTLKRHIKSMQETSISITDERAESYFSVIPKAVFPYSSSIEIDIYKEVLEMVVDVKNKYTTIDAEQLMKLKSKHSARMILLLEMINGFSANVAKRKHYDLDELNLLFGTNYKRLGLFEQKILIPIKSELDNTSKLSFLYQVKYDKSDLKAGRPKAVGIVLDLIINQSIQQKLF